MTVQLMLVCKLWHASIVHQPRLWNKMTLRLSVWRELVRRTKQVVEGCLARSNGLDLEVTLIIEDSDQEEFFPSWKYGDRTEGVMQNIAEIRGILDFLAGCSTSKEQREVPRWTFLAIDFSTGHAHTWNEMVLTPFFIPSLDCAAFSSSTIAYPSISPLPVHQG